jgi:hypothetical protein
MITHRELALRLGPELVAAIEANEVSAILDARAAMGANDWDWWAEVDLLIDEEGGVEDLLRACHNLDWRIAMELDPIPPWSLRAAIAHLAESGAIETGKADDQGQSKFARILDTNPRTVRRWLAGDNDLSGLRAQAVRAKIKEMMK